MKKKVLIIIGAVAVIAIIALVALKPFSKKDTNYTFETVKVEKSNIANTVTATGTLQAIKTVSVGTQVSGIIVKIYTDFNDNVKKNQVLAEIDRQPLLTQLDQCQSAVDQAQAQLNYQKATYERLKALYDKQLVAQSDYDQAEYNYKNAIASLANSKSAYSKAKVNLDYATITSPIDGVVLNRAVEEGQTVAASFSTPTLFSLAQDLTQMEVQTSVDEADIGKVEVGQRVEFTVDAYPDLKFSGSVSQVRLSPTTTNNVVTYTVILNAPNPDKKLMPGMTASATIFVEEKENALVLSGKAIRFTPDKTYLAAMFKKMMASGNMPKMPTGAPTGQAGSGQGTMPSMPAGGPMMGANSDPKSKTVWVKDSKTGGIRPNRIKIGIDNGNNVEVVSGLNEGDEVITVMTKGKETAKKTEDRPRGPFPF